MMMTSAQENLLLEFENTLKRKNLSKNTITAYAGSVRLYYSLYRVMSTENLSLFRGYLITRYRPDTVNLRVHAMNRFVRFLVEFDPDMWMPLSDFRLKSVKLQKKSFSDAVITNEDYETMKTRLKEDGKDLWYFVVRFLGATGARVSELVQIKVEHLTVGYLDLYSKGGKLRRIYFPDALAREALDWCGKKGIRTGFLFVNRQGRPLSTRGIRGQLKHFARLYGINEETVYPHSFRHRFAINFLTQFNDISLLADLMGHENIETTRIYLTKTSKEQQELLDELVTW